MTFRTDATIDRVEPGRCLQWRAHDRHKQPHGSRLVEPSGPASCRFTDQCQATKSVFPTFDRLLSLVLSSP